MKRRMNQGNSMKNHLLIAAALLCTSSTLFGQGQIIFNNRVSGQVSAPIYGPDPASPLHAQTGNPSAGDLGFPAGTTVYAGYKLSGTGYSAQLWAGPTPDSLSPTVVPGTTTIQTFTFKTGSSAGLVRRNVLAIFLARLPCQ